MTYCKECLKKQQRINQLEEQIDSLKAKLRYQERTAKEGFSGSSTPSSTLKVMPNSSKQRHRHRGGGKPGHKSHGRQAFVSKTLTVYKPLVPLDTDLSSSTAQAR
ncbi:MAG: hypothetical protein ACE5NM_08405 [Sedimentisphaerales bacterium]